MAYAAKGFVNQVGLPQGMGRYVYHTTDHPDVVEAANYFNNSTNSLGLAKGDIITVVQWSAAIFAAASTISLVKDFIVTNVITDALSTNVGAVNIAEIGINSAGQLSSLA